ncbi:unnamed protein product [Hydatigera taeniaeformis]|uniref:Ig-like domain-containing protein n=1 Tax=Hydatigena taeniaeformis TaxID=6205 RepID=A0A0R3XA03_HYDTA|nr:unnamed protein product [Hydatigera taeniaeformis]
MASRTLESALPVLQDALRFQISTLSEDLRLGGFTHRRVILSQLPSPTGMTQEQFEYIWMSPEGQPMTPQPSPEIYVHLKSPQQFGVYTIRVRGTRSGYTHELQSDVLLQSNPDGYSLWILGQREAVLPNSRVDVLCEVRPTHPGAKVRWVNAQNLMVAPNNRLVIERFGSYNEGSYYCEAFLPDGTILLKKFSRQMGIETDIFESGFVGDGSNSYAVHIVRYPSHFFYNNEVQLHCIVQPDVSVHIVRYPSHFFYNDEVQLHCIVQPDVSGVTFEWTKDGKVVGNDQVLDVPAFGRQDVGKYQCRATIQSVVRIAEEMLTPSSEDPKNDFELERQGLTMEPRVVNSSAFKPFELECIAHRPDVRPLVVLSSGANITLDGHFQLRFPDARKVIITVPRGLPTVYNGMSVRLVECA